MDDMPAGTFTAYGQVVKGNRVQGPDEPPEDGAILFDDDERDQETPDWVSERDHPDFKAEYGHG